MSPTFKRFKNDIMGIFWLGLSLFIGMALYSFNPSDPSFNSTGLSLEVTNLCGYFGSFLADALYQVFGLAAWVMVLGSWRMAYLGFTSQNLSFKNWRILWALGLLVTLCSLLALYWGDQFYFSRHVFIGGGLGLFVSKGLVTVFNPLGVGIILWSTAMILAVFYTEKSLGEFLKLFMKVGSWLALPPKKLFLLIKKSFVARRERKAINEKSQELAAESYSPSDSEKKEPSFSLKKSMGSFSFDLLKKNKNKEEIAEEAVEEEFEEFDDEEIIEAAEEQEIPKGFLPFKKKAAPKKRKVKMSAKVQRKIENWELPKIEMMEDPPASRMRVDEREVNTKAELLVDKLAQFSVGGKIVGVKTGPAVTMFEFKPNVDVKISKITELADDLSLALSAESVRIIAPIPGRDVVGIETSNSKRETVYLKDVVAENRFWEESIKLPIPLGRQADGNPKIVDLRKMPHLLVAGTTGSGKSVFVVSILAGLLFKHSPKTLKLILIDPKQVDLAAFDKLPHLMMPLIREPKKAVCALRWSIQEMEKRYRSMAKFGARNIESFNESVAELPSEKVEEHERLNEEMAEEGQKGESYYFTPQPFITIVVEEFGDLMAVDKGNVEQAVVRLAQMARACGIHLILAMQSPRKDVVTGLIKTNIPGRISFKVASKMDSRIILDDSGAERLLARGDMLFLAPGIPRPERHHGPWLTEKEIDAVVDFWADQGEPEYDKLAMAALEGSGGGFDFAGGDSFEEDEYDERYDEILSWVAAQKAVSASLIQRKFRLGYPRAARIIEVFENEGVVGPANGSKPREVLVSQLPD